MAVLASNNTSYITATTGTIDTGSVGVVDAWVYLTTLTISTTRQVIFGTSRDAVSNLHWEIELVKVGSDTYFGVAAANSGALQEVRADQILSVGWHHVALWADNTDGSEPWHFFVDGVRQTFTNISGTNRGWWLNLANGAAQTGTILTLKPSGAVDTTRTMVDAWCAEVRIWKRLLSEPNIAALAKGISPLQLAFSNGTNMDLIDWWALWNNTGPYPDYAGRNFTGTVTDTLLLEPHAPIAAPWPGVPGRSSFAHSALAFQGTPAEIDFSGVNGTLSVVVPAVSLTADPAVMAFHPPEGGVLSVARRGHGYKPKRRRMPNFSIRDAVQYWRGYPSMTPENLEKGRRTRRKRT